MKSKKITRILLPLFLPMIIIILWHIVTSLNLFSEVILPPISSVISGLTSGTQMNILLNDTAVSLLRVMKGYLIGSFLGIALGVLMGMQEKINRFFNSTFTFIRQIPIVAWIPLIIVWSGIGEMSKVIIIAMATFFTVLVNTISGIKGVNKEYLELARLYQLKGWKRFWKIDFPSSIPSILTGLRLGLGASWMAVVASELIGAENGIGYRINDSRALMRSDLVIICMLIIGIVGLFMDRFLLRLNRLMTPWKKED
ncbi:MAG TPA: ABC transporter permease [Candidatus Merdenecus merdavium]|nr:ABC transporter permease [Candidatus Merdenecus merdavium]